MTSSSVPRSASAEEGVVLLLVLVVIVLTIGSVYAFARTTLLDVMSLRHRSDRVRAELLVRSGEAIAKRAIADSAAEGGDEPTAWELVSRAPITVGPDAEIRISIEDDGARISLNGLIDPEGQPYPDSRPFLEALLENIIDRMPGRSEDKLYDPRELADGILDWIDTDDRTRLGSPEGSYWTSRGATGAPLDRPVLRLDELAGLPDVDAALLGELASYFSPYPLFAKSNASGVNPNHAPPHMLAAIYVGTDQGKQMIDRSDILRILRVREDGDRFCKGGSGASAAGTSGEDGCVSFLGEIGRIGQTVFPPLRFQGTVFAVEVEGVFMEARSRSRMVLDASEPSAPQVLFYRQD